MKLILTFCFFFLFYSLTFAQYKKDGTPDMRYKANRGSSGSSYSNTNSQTRYQSGYSRNGSYVQGHYKTRRNETNHDNYSTSGNRNSYTGSQGSRARDYSTQSNNYGSGRTIHTGSQGGQYYYNSKGNKVYVPKRN